MQSNIPLPPIENNTTALPPLIFMQPFPSQPISATVICLFSTMISGTPLRIYTNATINPTTRSTTFLPHYIFSLFYDYI